MIRLVRISAIWCSSCILTKRDWDEIKNDYAYEEYDYDMDADKIVKYNIGNVLPVIIVYKDNEEVGRIVGEKSKEQILEVIGD